MLKAPTERRRYAHKLILTQLSNQSLRMPLDSSFDTLKNACPLTTLSDV